MPTTGISLVREHTVGMRPSRALWVPFELGRPFGAPDNAIFQNRVLKAVLALLEREDGPVILEDFPDDAPSYNTASDSDQDGMACPWRPPKLPTSADAKPRAILRAEMAQLAPWYGVARQARGRSTGGISGLKIGEVADFLSDFLEGKHEAPISDEHSLGQFLRCAVEDLRSWYLEAAGARPGIVSSSNELAGWFWGETEAGALILKLRQESLSSSDESVAAVAQKSLVPMAQNHRHIRSD